MDARWKASHPALAALCAAVLMVNAGVGKGLLSWRLNAIRRRPPRKAAPPRRQLEAMIPGGLR